MNKIFLAITILALALSSCRQQKELAYFDGLVETDIQNNTSQEVKDYNIRMHDILYIRVLSYDEKINSLFDAVSTSNVNQTSMMQSGGMYYTGYSVDENGMVEIPEIGYISVIGKTVAEAKDEIRSRASEYLKDATIIVKLSNMKYTFLGEVNRPGVVQNLNNQTTILEAIGLAGDLTDYGDRKHVWVLRPTVGGMSTHMLNLNDPELISSPYFFLKPNDVIYVPPLKAKATRMFAQDYGIFISIITSTIATASVVLTIILNLKK